MLRAPEPLTALHALGNFDSGVLSLDGRVEPILAHVKLRARKVLLAKLFPAARLNKTSIGQINGEFDLAGHGNSVRRMLATANGQLGLVVAGGEISQLMMERVGLHLWEILELNVTGDRLVKLHCAVADFNVKDGSMRADALVLDTEVTTIVGTGSIDLAQEKLDLTLNQKTKNTSPLALRSPIHVRGSFARPDASVDKGRVALRGLGALALGLVNPFLALIPLIDAGPGSDSDCRQLIGAARKLPRSDKQNPVRGVFSQGLVSHAPGSCLESLPASLRNHYFSHDERDIHGLTDLATANRPDVRIRAQAVVNV